MNTAITQLAPILDNASYIDSFVWFFLLMPLLVGIPLFVYGVIVSAVSFIRSLI